MSHQQAIDLPPLPEPGNVDAWDWLYRSISLWKMSDGNDILAAAMAKEIDAVVSRQMQAYARAAILADRSRSAAPVAVPDGFVLVPRDPTEEMWVHLARDIVWFLYSTSAPHRGVKFYKWLDNMGREAPAWLRAEIPDVDHSPSKGTWAVCIYKAMLAAAAAPPGLAPLVAGVGEVL